MKMIAAILCLAAAANAASVLPLETSVVKSDRVGDNFSYSIHRNQGYAVSPDGKHVGLLQSVVPSVDVKQVPYVAQQSIVPLSQQTVVPLSQQTILPVELQSQVLPASTAYISQRPVVSVAAQQPVVSVAAPVDVKEHQVLPYISQQPFVSVPVSQVDSRVVSPVQVKSTQYQSVIPSYLSSYVQPYVSSLYPYSYSSYAPVYSVVKAEKY